MLACVRQALNKFGIMEDALVSGTVTIIETVVRTEGARTMDSTNAALLGLASLLNHKFRTSRAILELKCGEIDVTRSLLSYSL